MKAPIDLSRAVLAVVLALPGLAALLRGTAPGTAVLLCTAASIAGLLLVDDLLRAVGRSSVAAATTLLVLYGTPLVWYAVAEPGRSAASFLASAIVARAFWAR